MYETGSAAEKRKQKAETNFTSVLHAERRTEFTASK